MAKDGSGKTRFTRGKRPGESWLDRREAAVKAGEFKLPERKPIKK